MAPAQTNLLQGTLDLLILKALVDEMLHGYAIAEWIRQRSEDELLVEEGTLYPALHRLEDRGWVESEWGLSENKRRAKYYRLTPLGRRQLTVEVESWGRYVRAVDKVIRAT